METASLIIYILAILLVVGAIVSFSRSKKSKVLMMPKNIAGIVFILVGGFLFALQMGWLVQVNSNLAPFAVSGVSEISCPVGTSLVGGVCVEAGKKIDVTGCSVTDSQTITLSATDKYTNAAVGGSHRYSLGDAPASTVSDAGTLTAYVGNTIKVLWMNESKSSYFSKPETFTVTCNGLQRSDGTVINGRTASTKLVNNGTLTASLKNHLGNAISSATSATGATNETLGTGDVKDVEITLSGDYQKEFPYGFVGVVDINKSVIDKVVLHTGETTDNEFASATVPKSDSIAYASESSTKAYEIPVVVGSTNTVFKANIDVSDSRNPTGSTGDDIIIRLYPKNYYVNNKNGGSYDGPSAEDEDQSLVRGQATTVYIHLD